MRATAARSHVRVCVATNKKLKILLLLRSLFPQQSQLCVWGMNFKTSFSSVVFLASFSNRKAQFTHTQLSKIEEITNQNREYKQKNSYPIHTHTQKQGEKTVVFATAFACRCEQRGNEWVNVASTYVLFFVCLFVCLSPFAVVRHKHSTAHIRSPHTRTDRETGKIWHSLLFHLYNNAKICIVSFGICCCCVSSVTR